MQKYYSELYKEISLKNNYVIDYLKIQKINDKNKLMELENFRNSYGFLVHRYETLRKTKIWKVAKRIRRRR